MRELYVPVFMPLEHKIVTYGDHNLLKTQIEADGSAERSARTLAANCLGLTAIKAVGPIEYDAPVPYEQVAGYAVHTSIDQPYRLRTGDRFLVKVHDVDAYLNDDRTSEINGTLVEEALRGLPYRRRA